MLHEVFNISVVLFSGCLLLHASRHLLSLWLKFGMLLAVVLSYQIYVDFGKIDMIFPDDEAYQEEYGDQPKFVYFHWHEVYHYYLGGKYFPELGYSGLYETVLYADSVSPDPYITARGMRSLRDPTHHITAEEGLRRGREEFRPNFTDERWQEFMNDLAAMKAIAGNDWLDLGLFDAGYNPPPTWAVFGNTVANLVPITQDKAWFGDQRPDWYQVQWVAIFDPLMLLAALGCVFWAFGWLGGVAFIIFYCLNDPADIHWIAGSYFRFTWLAELIIGLCFLKKGRYVPAGIFLGLSACDRIFPAAFLGAAGLAVLAQDIRKKQLTNTLRFGGGAAAAITVLAGISLVMFGPEAWVAFFEKINTHKDLFFVNHIGYRRIAVWGPEVPNQNFWWEPGLDRFRVWNAALNAKWHEVRHWHWVLWAVMIATAAFACLYARAEEAALLLGGLLFFLFEIPANYYYIYFPMVFVVVLGTTYSPMRQAVLAGYVLLWASLWHYSLSNRDELVANFYKCSAFFAFFCLWVFGRGMETLLGVLRNRQEPRGGAIAKSLEIG